MADSYIPGLDEYEGTGPVPSGALFVARNPVTGKDRRVPGSRLPGGLSILPARQTFRYQTRTEADAGDGGEVLADLDWNLVYTYQLIFTEFYRNNPADLNEVPRPLEQIAVFDPSPTAKQGWRTSGGAAGNAGNIGLQLVPLTDPRATGVLQYQQSESKVLAGEVRFHTDSQGAFYALAKVDMVAPIPAPVRGVTDAYWKPEPTPPVPGSVDFGTLLGRVKTSQQAQADKAAGNLKAGTDIVTGLWNGANGGVILTPITKSVYGSVGYIYVGGKPIEVKADLDTLTYTSPDSGSGGGTTRDPYDVSAAKRIEVVDANVPAYLETDTAFYGCEFVDEVRGAGKPTCYKCRPSAPAVTGGATVWKWFRIDIL